MSAPDGNESLINRICKDIAKTGYPTEVMTATRLTARKWHCVLGPSFLDEKSGISREFDVRAYKELRSLKGENPITLGIYLLIECKKSDDPWVFFTAPSEIERHKDLRYGDFINAKGINKVPLFTRGWLGDGPIIPHDEWLSFHHYATQQRWGHNYYEPFKKQGGEEHGIRIHTAIQSVVTATRHYVSMAWASERWVRIYYPLIVFDSQLFEAQVTSKENIDVIATDHIVLKHHNSFGSRHDDREGVDGRVTLIDVVRSTFLDGYCEQIEREQNQLYELLSIADQEGKLTPKNAH